MPAAGSLRPDSMGGQIVKWLADHPGDHRARDVATGLGQPPDKTRPQWSQRVGNVLNQLYGRGLVARGAPVTDSRLGEVNTYRTL